MGVTSNFNSTIQMLLSVGNFIFDIWFLFIIAPILNRKKNSKAGLTDMFAVWVVLAIVRILMIFNPQPIPSMFILEPLNTILFGLAGLILLFSMLVWRRIQNGKFQKKANSLSQTEDFLKLSPREFEDMIVELYRRAGHKAKRTGTTGDHGVDILIDAKNGEKWVVQCKRWRGTVGEPVVRDFYGVVQHEKADKGIVFTTGRFSAPAQQWANGKPIALYDGNKLVEIWSRSKAQQDQAQQTTSSPINT